MKLHCLYDELASTKKLKAHPKNRNKHSNEQIARLAQILDYQGWRYAIKISKRSGFITSGHGRLLAAQLKGWDQVPVVYQDYESEEQEYADVQADNAIASWAELDLAAIHLDIPDLGPDFDIDLLGIKDFEIDAADKFKEGEDDVPEVRKTNIRLGDLFSLGAHRLLCGDSPDRDSVTLLMNGEKADMVYTDPPYGMKLETDYSGIIGSSYAKSSFIGGSKKHRPVIGDNEDYDPSFILNTFKSTKEIFLWGGDYYCQLIPKGGGWLVWDKTGGQNSLMDAGFSSNFELCWSKQKHKRDLARITWKGVVGRGGEGGVGAGTVHPTQKPIKLAEWFFECWGKDKTNIVDLYLGSGSTLIACEKTNRKCFGMEIDPQYCQVIIDRYEKFSDKKAIQLN